MRFQLGIQVLLLIVAVTIVFTIVRPKLVDIGETQNEIANYKEALANIGKYNQRIQQLTNQLNSMSSADRSALFRYMPEEIDTVAVSRDITNIVERNRLLMLDITFDQLTPVTALLPGSGEVYQQTNRVSSSGTANMGTSVNGDQLAGSLYSQRFEVRAVGTYEQMKTMLEDFERNSYPLRVIEFNFNLEDETNTLIQYSITLETYSLPGTS